MVGSVQRIFVRERKCVSRERESECAYYSFGHPLSDVFLTLQLQPTRLVLLSLSQSLFYHLIEFCIFDDCYPILYIQVFNFKFLRAKLAQGLIKYSPPEGKEGALRSAAAKVLTTLLSRLETRGNNRVSCSCSTTMYILHIRLRCLSLCTPIEQILRAV